MQTQNYIKEMTDKNTPDLSQWDEFRLFDIHGNPLHGIYERKIINLKLPRNKII